MALEPADIHPAATTLRCVDSQWVPRGMLREMVAHRQSLAEVAGPRLGLVRSEYLRALLSVPQVIVSRGALLRGPALNRDLLSEGPERDALGALLGSGVVVPLLQGESSPLEAPGHPVDQRVFAAWTRLCSEVTTSCLPADWLDASRRRRFAWFASGLHQLDAGSLGRHLGLADGQRDAFQKRLTQVALWCAAWAGEGRAVTRDELYRAFVVMDGSRPADGAYDPDKPFSGEIKQLLDVQHGGSAAAALSRFSTVASDSLQRAALQEWRLPADPPATISLAEVARRIRAVAPSGRAEGAYIASAGVLGLDEVLRVRRGAAWGRYAASLGALLADPLDFAAPGQGAAAVADGYVRLARAATDTARRRPSAPPVARWAPVTELVVEVAGAALSVIPALLGREPAACRAAGRISDQATGRAVPFAVRMVVRGLPEHGSSADLEFGLPLFEGRLDAAAEQWAELLAGFGLRAGAAEDGVLPAERVAVMERPGSGVA